MSLSASDKANVKAIWNKILPKSDDIGSNALSRMLIVYPQTKVYFASFGDLSPGSPQVKKHGITMMNKLNECVNNIDDIGSFLSSTREVHATKLSIDPAHFKILANTWIVVFGIYLSNDFTPEVNLSVDKFLQQVMQALTDNYR